MLASLAYGTKRSIEYVTHAAQCSALTPKSPAAAQYLGLWPKKRGYEVTHVALAALSYSQGRTSSTYTSS